MLIVGVDGHKQTLACSLVDDVGRELDARTFANAPAGHDELVAWAESAAGPEVLGYGLESALSFTRVLCDRLVGDGAVVFDVPPKLVERTRRQRGIGKSDIIDAREIARAVLRDHARMVALRPTAPLVRDLKLLVSHHTQLTRERTQAANRLHSDLVRIAPGYQELVPTLDSKPRQRAAARLLRRQAPGAHVTIARSRLQRIAELDKQIADNKRLIQQHLRSTGSGLPALPWHRPDHGRAHPRRGTRRTPPRERRCLRPAQRHRPHPGVLGAARPPSPQPRGNRRLNHAIHTMALVQSRCDPRAQAYLAKHRAAGKTSRDAMRCLKRRLSDVIYRQLIADLTSATSTPPIE